MLAAVALATAACAGPVDDSAPCSSLDPTLASSSFIVVRAPSAGARSPSPMRTVGCSRTFESNVVWELRGRDGRLLASGSTTGGGVDGPAPFTFSAEFDVSEAEVATLEVFMPDASGGEGFPPPRTELQVVLTPGT